MGGFFTSQYIVNTPKKQTDPLVEQNKSMEAQFDTVQENEKRRLQNSYKDLIQQQTNALNRRGMFGSSVASEDIGKVNYALGQSLAELGGQSAQMRVNQQDKTLANMLAQQQLQQQANQFDANLAYKKQQDLLTKQQNQFKQDLLLGQLLEGQDPFNQDMYFRRIMNKYSLL